MIKQCIDKFNEKFEDENINLRFRINSGFFELRLASKKSGKPKLDFPKFDNQMFVFESNSEDFAITYSPDGIYDVNVLKQLET